MAGKMTRFERLVCPDCGELVLDDYMVVAALWQQHGVGKGHLHVRCLEKRVGRLLHIEDFLPCTANECLRFGYEMGSRAKPR